MAGMSEPPVGTAPYFTRRSKKEEKKEKRIIPL